MAQSKGGKAVSLNQHPEWIKCNELNAIQSQEIIALKDRIKRLDETLEGVTDKLDGAWGIYMKFKEAKP
jgi:hypothetical protein